MSRVGIADTGSGKLCLLRRISRLFLLISFLTLEGFAQLAAAADEMPAARMGQSAGQPQPPAPATPAAVSSAPAPDVPPKPLPSAPQPQGGDEGKQSSRILWMIPNYRAVGADAHLPPLSPGSKFVLATQDSFDYSSLIFAGFMAGIGQAENSTPEFRQGGLGYSRYLWHAFVDQANGNYFTEFIMPSITHEDPRYYTLFHGKVLRRATYAIGRLAVTRTDSGGSSINFSEIVGNGAGAGVACLYYPRGERTWTKTGQRWATQVGIDGISNILKEFWPDIRHNLFRQ